MIRKPLHTAAKFRPVFFTICPADIWHGGKDPGAFLAWHDDIRLRMLRFYQAQYAYHFDLVADVADVYASEGVFAEDDPELAARLENKTGLAAHRQNMHGHVEMIRGQVGAKFESLDTHMAGREGRERHRAAWHAYDERWFDVFTGRRASAPAADYAQYLEGERWNRVRAAITMLRQFRCEAPYCHAWLMGSLQVHHLTYDRLGCEKLADLELLCFAHHRQEHNRQRGLRLVREVRT